MLTAQQVRHIATLARLGLSESEVEKFARQLSDILQYVEKLNEVDTEKVLPTSQVTGLKNVLRKDEVKNFENKDEILACSQLPLEQNQILVEAAITAH